MDIQNQSYSEIVAKMAAKHREIELLAAFKKAEEQIKKNYEKEQEDRIKDIKEDLEDDFYTLVIEEAKLKIQLEEIQILEEKSEKQREEAMEKAKKEYEEMYSQLPMYMQAELPKVEEGSENTFTYPTYSLDDLSKLAELYPEYKIIYDCCEAQFKSFHKESALVDFVMLDNGIVASFSEDVYVMEKAGVACVMNVNGLTLEEKETRKQQFIDNGLKHFPEVFERLSSIEILKTDKDLKDIIAEALPSGLDDASLLVRDLEKSSGYVAIEEVSRETIVTTVQRNATHLGRFSNIESFKFDLSENDSSTKVNIDDLEQFKKISNSQTILESSEGQKKKNEDEIDINIKIEKQSLNFENDSSDFDIQF